MALVELRLRIQVIDQHPQQIDVSVPQYIPVSDLSQRVIRDAGMQSHWVNKLRRHYYIFARGRMLDASETLESIGLIDGEVIYLLPQPDARVGVVEQNPEYPEVKPYLGQGIQQLLLTLGALLSFSFLWGMALTAEQSMLLTILPSLGLSTLCVGVARHAWGGWAFNIRVGGTALILYLVALMPPLFAPVLITGMELGEFIRIFAPGIFLGFAGLMISWLAWWGPVEPLNRQRVQEQRQADEEQPLPICGICQRGVEPEYQVLNVQCHVCQGQQNIFHKGCLTAKYNSNTRDPRLCPVCLTRIA